MVSPSLICLNASQLFSHHGAYPVKLSAPDKPILNRELLGLFLEVSKIVKNNYLWKTDSQLNHLAQVRYAHGDELTDLPGVTGIGMGKDHIIIYVSDESVEVPAQIEDVKIIKIRR